MRQNKRMLRIEVGVMLAIFAISIGAYALDVGSIIKVGGIALLVDRFGPQLDKFINSLMGNNKVAVELETKVVPILSVGKGGYIGAAQVMGLKEDVDRVKAVAQLEGSFSGKLFRVKALVPIGSKEVKGGLTRIKGVGISAVIDVHI